MDKNLEGVCKILRTRWPYSGLRFEAHPKQNVPLVVYARGVVRAFADVQYLPVRMPRTELKRTETPQDQRSHPKPYLDMAIFNRLVLARERMEKKYLAENRGEMPHPAQIWMIVWAKDGLWGSNIEYLYPEGPWPQVLELGYFKQLGREKYVSEEAVALDAARKSDKSLSGTLLPSDESRVARGAGFFGD